MYWQPRWQRCRLRRKRCLQPSRGDACGECTRRRVPCSLVPVSRRSKLSPRAAAPVPLRLTAAGSEVDLPGGVVEELIENYIRLILDRPHSLFHIPSLRTRVQSRQLPPGLLYALLAFGSRFHSDNDIRSQTSAYIAKAKASLHLDLENICLENIQTCVLLANLSSSAMQSTSEALYVSIGVRMAEILGVNITNHTDSIIVCETKRRVWWTLFMADRWCSLGRNLRRTMKDYDRTVDLPMDEYAFHSLAIDHAGPATEPQPGLWAYNVMLAELLGPIQDLNKQLMQGDITEAHAELRVTEFARSLRHWEESLPEGKRMSIGGPFMALHTFYHHCSSLLFFQYLDVDRPETPQSKAYADLSRHHALVQSSLIKMSREVPNCEVVTGGVGYMAIVSSAILIHMLMFSQEHDPLELRARLSSNYEAITALEEYWPSLKNSKACLDPGRSQKYKLDKWMVRFLLEHHLPLDDFNA
ncbi:hypothetical protein GQ53DRAFT_789092 [Thozetella sp. PMI_491]|nr:hypothetical protein GQ53DRAFT_789092 [Thozetella sp. PMI_491]